MEEATTLCSNCQRPIAASNFVIHSLHCQRNLTKCGKCGEAVPRSSLEEHEVEFHSKVDCPDCHTSVEKPLLDTHKKTACRSRQLGCRFCELEMPACDVGDHENYCGSRTKKCEDCGEYVMLKYEQLHLDSNHRFLKLDDEPGPTATWIRNDIESGSFRPAKSNNNKKPQLSTGKFDDDEESDDMPNLFANLMKKKKAVGTTPLYPGIAYPIGGGPQRFVSNSPPPYQDVQDDSTDLVALPCEFCEAMIPVNQLILHQTGCRMDVASFGRSKKSQNDTSKKKINPSVSEVDGGEFKGGSERLNELWEDPKEFNKLENTGLFDMRRNAVASVDKANDRQKNGRSESNVDMRRNAIDEGSEASLNQGLEDDGFYLPCEFCADGYPPSLLLEHQDVCEYNPKNLTEAAPAWSPQDDPSGSKNTEETSQGRKFDDSDYNTFLDPDQAYSNNPREKCNITNTYKYLSGNFTVASEWSDDSDSRPTSATGAIPKQKAGKLNFARKVNQEVQGSRPSHSLMSSNSRKAMVDDRSTNSNSDHIQGFHIRNNLKGLQDEDNDE